MAYLVLARKYRPATFDEIVGQEHVTRALKNAIRLDRVAHAFLFTGARGVGKTTAARVLAKALQCENGPTPDPCGTCRSCTEITSGSSLDVFEIDGASNRGINEIRELRDGVAYAPQRDPYKIYIIDEVHMLTSEAFNALLKTLEEPPRHVKFIFATTEPQKIPVTILSRCQRYDFKRVPLTQVREHLDSLLESESISLPPEGVRMVARESEGSGRDALSLLDRVISFAGDGADAAAVSECLGIADRDWIVALLRTLLDGETAEALEVIAKVHGYGYDMRSFTSEVLMTLRDLIVVKVCGPKAKAAELSDAEAEELNAPGGSVAVAALQRMFQILLKASDTVAHSRHPRLALEMALVRCATVRELQSVPEVLSRLEALEARLTAGGGGSAAGARPPQRNSSPHAQPQRHAPAPRQVEPPAQPRSPQRQAPAPRQMERAPTPSKPPEQAPAPTQVPPPRSEPKTAAAAHAPSGVGAALAAEDWPVFVRQTLGTDPLLASMLENATVLESAPGALLLAVTNKFYHSQLSGGRNSGRLAELVTSYTGTSTRITVNHVENTAPTIAQERKERYSNIEEERRNTLMTHPVTRAVEEQMSGQVVDVRVEEARDDN